MAEQEKPKTPPRNDAEISSYYNLELRGTKAPDYTLAEATYRSERLSELNNAYVTREQPLMEMNNLAYSQSDLINFQADLAFNPPKKNPADSRIVSGYVREKDRTVTSVIMDMNFQPRVMAFDKRNTTLVDACQIFTARLKKTLIQMNFKDELENIASLLVARGNVFVDTRKQEKWKVNKIRTGKKIEGVVNQKVTWKTVYEKEYDYCSIDVLPNTAVFPMNLRGPGLKEQPRVYTVRHYPISELARRFKNNPRWASVPKTATTTVPTTVNGIWGDWWLQQPADGYGELIVMQSPVFNEFQEWVNGVQMHPVQQEGNLISGYPLTEVSPSGNWTLCKGDYERIPFFFFSKSNPDKNFVKEEELNEVMRLMVLMLRQKTQPSVGNNTNRVLQPNIWDPNMIISDIKKEDLSILKPNDGIGQAEFSFYKLLTESIDDTSVSKSLEGQNNKDMTLGQYTDQKKESLKKLGLCLDRVIDLLRQIYWNVLENEIAFLDQKTKQYKEDGSFLEAYRSFSVEDSVDGRNGNVQVTLMDDTSDIDPYKKAQEEADMPGLNRSYYAKPASLQEIFKRMRDQIYIDVVSAPEGEQQSLLAILFNLLTQYVNLKGGDNRKINFDYIETIIADNSGFDSNKLFLEEAVEPPVPSPMGGESMVPQNMNPKAAAAL